VVATLILKKKNDLVDVNPVVEKVSLVIILSMNLNRANGHVKHDEIKRTRM